MGSAFVVAVIPEEYMMPQFLRIRRNGVTRKLLEVYHEDYHTEERCFCTTHELLELYPDAYFVLTFRPEDNVWSPPAHALDTGWWHNQEEVDRYSQEDVGDSLKEFLNKKLEGLDRMVRMPGRWLLGSARVSRVICKAA